MSESHTPTGPDLGAGISAGTLSDGGMLAGHVGDDDVLLARKGEDFFAIGAYCTHYHGSLADGLLVGDTVRCPLHHACFSLRTGAVLRAPALDPVACYHVERRGDTVFVRGKQDSAGAAAPTAGSTAPASVVIIGGGGAGLAAADTLRREGYDGPITMLSADDAPPSDRPNLSKEYLSGEASEDWIPLRSPDYYTDNRIDLRLRSRVSAIDVPGRQVILENGDRHQYGALLIATGADPVRLPIDGAAEGQVRYLRSLSDSNAIIAKAATAKRAVVIGASFIGLEVAASLRIRGLSVDVVAPDKVPLERILGAELGAVVRQIHEAHGVTFHLGDTVARVDGDAVTLRGGARLTADLIVAGVGVRPAVALAEQAGLKVDRGIVVSEYPGDERSGDLRCRRRRAVARRCQRRASTCRALGGGRTSGSGRGKEHPGTAGGLFCRAVFLEPALRRHHPLLGLRGIVGSRQHRGQPRESGLFGVVHPGRPDCRRRDHRPRSREPRGRSEIRIRRARVSSSVAVWQAAA